MNRRLHQWLRAASPAARRRAGSDQRGYTLIEVLAAIAISALIFVPLSSWVILAMRQQPVLQDRMLRTTSSGFLGSYFPTDVTIAGKAATTTTASWASDCPGTGPGKGSPQVVMVTGGTDVYKVVYSEAPASDDASQRSVWRRTCDASTGALLSAKEVFPDVVPGSTDVTCAPVPTGTAECRQVKIVTQPRTQRDLLQISATRRLDEASVPVDTNGDPRPTAVIDEVSRTGALGGSQVVTAQFSATSSSVPNGTIVGYRWEFQYDKGVAVVAGGVDQATVTADFPRADSYTVLLTVTDDRGRTNTTYREVLTSNERPVALVTTSPSSGETGSLFSLSAASSYDPDGTIVAYDWLLTLPGANGTGSTVVLDPVQNPTYVPPPGTNGVVGVALTVTDNQGGRGTTNSSFIVIDPTAPTSTTVPPDGSTTTTVPGSTVPEQPGTIVAAFVSSTSAAPSTQSFDASGTTGIGAGFTATYAWDFGDGASGSGRNPVHTYGNAGQYTARLTVTTDDGRSASVADNVFVGGAPPAPTDVRTDGGSVLWAAVPGARRYLVDFEFQTNTDCYRLIGNQAVGLGPNPSKPIPANPCPAGATARARVGAEANGAVSWSGWISIPALGAVNPPAPAAAPEVVK